MPSTYSSDERTRSADLVHLCVTRCRPELPTAESTCSGCVHLPWSAAQPAVPSVRMSPAGCRLPIVPGGMFVKLQRPGLIAAVIAGALALSACGSGNTSTGGGGASPSGGATADCASGTLSWDGSSAQKTAVTEWTKQYQTKCADASINYQGQG